jgi:hypothetical protein
VLTGRPGNNPFCHYQVLRLQERGWREVIVHKEAPAGHLPFDHGRFEIMVEDAEGRRHGQDIFARDDFQDLMPGAGASLDTLVLCEVCDRFFYEGEPECPHCRSNAASGVSIDDAHDGVDAARRVVRHMAEIERILKGISDSAGRAPSSSA